MEGELGANRRSISSIIITLSIIALLIMSGPAATGLKLTMTADKTSVEKGSTITFTLIVNLTSPDAYVPIQGTTLNITGPENRTWTFNPFTGNVTSGNNFSDELTVTPSGSYSGYGYGYGYAVYGGYGYNFGYGYGYGTPNQVTYTISLQTDQMTVDSNNEYNATAYVYADGKTFKSSTVSFKIVAAPTLPSGGGGGGGGGGVGPSAEVLIVANSIDSGMANEFLGLIKSFNIKATMINASEFTPSVRTGNRHILILGGPDAPEGIGEIVKEVLTDSEENDVRVEGAQLIFIKFNVYTHMYTHNQIVVIIGGSDRYNTQAAEIKHAEAAKDKIFI